MKKILFLLAIIPLADLINPGLPVTHDGGDHVARIANFYQSLSEGNIIPRWAANLNWGFGTPILMFLYPLPSYIASSFHFLGFSFVDSTKLVFGITYILSGLAMYLWVNTFLDKRAAFVSGALYLFAPYRFVDLYVRGAIGEHVAFVFPPLILYFLLKLSKIPPPRSPFGHLGGVLKGLPRGGFWYVAGGSFSLAGLILSHNAISLMFLPLIILYTLYLFWQSSQRRALLGRFGILGILGFGLSAFFWFPAFFEGKYTLRDIVTSGEYAARFVPFENLFYGPWSFGGSAEFTTQVGIVQWLMVVLSAIAIVVLHRKKAAIWILGVGLFLLFWLTLILMTQGSRFVWEMLTVLQKFQFPWRFLSVTVFITAVLGGLVIVAIPKRLQLLAACFLLLALLWFNKDYWHARDYLIKPQSFFTGIYPSTTDTGESSPRWSVRFMEKEPNTHVKVISGEAIVYEGKRLSTLHAYVVDASKRSRILENTLYFPGWEVWVDGQKLPIASIEFQDPAHRGLITFFVEKGSHAVVLRFAETKLRLFANYISLASLLAFVILLWKKK